MQPIKSTTKLVPAVFLTVLTWLFAGCQAAPPVQEMSDARQAIAVARGAGAEDSASIELKEAEAFLDSARQNLNQRLYGEARRDAISAKRRALDALALTESIRPNPR